MARKLYSIKKDNLIFYPPKLNGLRDIRCLKITTRLCDWKDVFYWNLVTLGRAKAYVVYNEETLVHYSYVLRGKAKFSFLGKSDIEIGPCWTHQEYRGQGIYPTVLSQIILNELSEGGSAYMIIDESNKSSQHGAEKVGFMQTGNCVERDRWKRHHIKR